MSDDKHEKALDLTEQALDATEAGDAKGAGTDEVVHDLDEAENTSVKPAE